MFYQDVIIQIHEGFLIDKAPYGKQNNPHFSNSARDIAINMAIRGNQREDGNGYVTSTRTNKNNFKRLPKKK